MEQNRIDISGFLETMDQMCQSMRGAEENMANQFTLQTDDELDAQLEAMTSPAHYMTSSQSTSGFLPSAARFALYVRENDDNDDDYY